MAMADEASGDEEDQVMGRMDRAIPVVAPERIRKVMAALAGVALAVAMTVASPNPSFAATGGADARYSYEANGAGSYLANGSGDGNAWNYPQTPDAELAEAGGKVQLDDEGYVIVPNAATGNPAAFLKKSAAEVPGSQGLFAMTLDVKGNQIEHPVDVVLAIDFSSTMSGAKLENALAGVRDFLDAVDRPLADGRIRVAAVAYNREVYAMNDFSTDHDEILGFLENTAKSGSGTFVQKGLYAAQSLFQNGGRPDAEHLLVHVGDGSANCAYLLDDNAVAYPNDGQIVAMGGYSADVYYTAFQTQNASYYSSITTSDPDAVFTDDTQMLSNYTLGTAIDLKNDGIDVFSIGVDPSTRGKYTAFNLASYGEKSYVAIDADLVGLSEALAGIASDISETINGGSIVDPMGNGVLLQQGASGFGPDDYALVGYRKVSDGSWIEAPELVASASVSASEDTIELSGLKLGADERAVLTYHVRLDTEAADFEPDAWYLANGETTLDRLDNGVLANFPIPSIKAPSVVLSIAKTWDDTVHVGGSSGFEADYSSLRPDSIDYVVERREVVSPDAWTRSEPLQLAKDDRWSASVSAVVPEEGQGLVKLPAYNNAGESFGYAVSEVGVPDGYSWEAAANGTVLTMTNRLKTATFSFMKTDLGGNPLEGAQFALYDAKGSFLCGPVVSAQDGSAAFSSLPAGSYTVREVASPEGYAVGDVELSVVVAPDENGILQVSVTRGDGLAWRGTLSNAPVDPESGGGADVPGTKIPSGSADGQTGSKLATTGDAAPAAFAALVALGALSVLVCARRRRGDCDEARR